MSRFFPFIAIIFAALLFFIYIKPTYSGSIQDTKQSIKGYDDALLAAQKFQQKEAQLTQARALIPAESLARLSEFLPDGVDNVQLILDMDALAARSGVTLSDFNIQGAPGSANGGNTSDTTPQSGGLQPIASGGLTSSSPIDSLNLTFKATGTYSAFRTFLSGMENSLRPIDVVDLNVTESQTGVYEYDVTVRIYWLR